MTSVADRTIDALRSIHDELAAAVSGLSDEQLIARSGASEWSVAQVLSHLGSGAEISLATLRGAMAATTGPGNDFNQEVWARWNALSPRDQASGFLATDEQLVEALEALTAEERQSLHVEVGFLPSPIPIAAYTGMRLNEAAQHSWDVRVSLDPVATIAADTATLLAEHFATSLSFLLGFTGKADALDHPAVIDIRGSDFALVIAATVSLSTSTSEPTATFTGQLEAAIRLLAGRLTTPYTPTDVEVTGNVTLDDLRRVFPGY
ncbi:MAG: maleylpyruvate isomerase family mycothiol-dependent enzyme [Mycobacterium sp.]|nr:maleylpyruvate isomerase family mycothiol-dependent enzyme [Mycobacterium sp.]